MILTPDMTNMAIPRKAAKDVLYLHHAKNAKYTLADRLKHQEGFSLRFFNSKWAGGFNPCIETDLMPLEHVLLTPEMTNMAISRIAAKTHQIYIHAKSTKYPLAEWQKIRMALASNFSIAVEQVVLTPAFKPIFQ